MQAFEGPVSKHLVPGRRKKTGELPGVCCKLSSPVNLEIGVWYQIGRLFKETVDEIKKWSDSLISKHHFFFFFFFFFLFLSRSAYC